MYSALAGACTYIIERKTIEIKEQKSKKQGGINIERVKR